LAIAAGRAAPGRSDFLDTLGWVYFKKGDYQTARKSLEQALSLEPGNVAVQEHLGEVLMAQGDRRGALERLGSAASAASQADAERIRRRMKQIQQ